MKWTVSIRAEAERDLAQARAWYDSQSAGLGDRFLDAVAIAIRELEANPTRAPLYYRQFRRHLLCRFPYKLFYQVLDDRVLVFRALHAKQLHQPRLRDP